MGRLAEHRFRIIFNGMHSKEKRLFNFRDDSRDFDFRLVKVQREIARGEVAYQELLLLCNSVNIDIPQFNALAKQYGGQDAVKEAIKRHGSDYQLHLVVSLQEEEEASDPTLKEYHEGWLATLDRIKEDREEALRRSKGRYVHTLPDPFEEV